MHFDDVYKTNSLGPRDSKRIGREKNEAQGLGKQKAKKDTNDDDDD